MTGKEPDLSPLLPDDPVVAARGSAISAAARDAETHGGRGRAGLAVGAGVLAMASVVAAVLLFAGGSSSPTPAYGAELVRFAESTPLLLLDEEGWRVRNVIQWQEHSGRMEFGPGSPAPPKPRPSRSEIIRREAELRYGVRKVTVGWAPWKRAGDWLTPYRSHGYTATAPVLETVAHINPGPRRVTPGAHGLRTMLAVWKEGDLVVTLLASVPDLAALRERLSWVTKVDAETWLDAMPPRVVKAAEYGGEVEKMLRGIPLPAGFDPSAIPDRGPTTSRYSVGKAVGGAVACEWFRQWYEARADRDPNAAREARGVLLRSGSWPVFRRITKEGPYPQLVVEFAEALPRGVWGQGRSLRQVIGSGCTYIGFGFDRPQAER